MSKIKTHKELDVYAMSFNAAMEIFNLTKSYPKEELYSLTDQIRRSSRSVSANIGEAWSARYYPKSFISKLIIAESEATETQVWLDYSFSCNYMSKTEHDKLYLEYDYIIGKLVNMLRNPDKWSI